MKKNLFCVILLVFIVRISEAQLAIFKSVSFVDSVSQLGLKKFGIKLSFDGINVPVIFKTVDFFTNQAVYYGDSIPNLLNGNMPMSNLSSIYYQCYAISTLNSNDVYGPLVVYPVSENVFSFSNITVPTGTNCDGYIEMFGDQGPGPNYDVTFSYPPTIIYNFGSNFGGTSANMNNNFKSNLCSRKYRITAPYNCFYSYDGNYYPMGPEEDFIVLLGQYAFPSSTGFDVQVNPYQQASSPLCDGKANVIVTNSTASCLYSFDGAAYTSSDSITNLCEGIHTVKVKNSTDSVGKYFIISNTNSVINNPNPYGPVVDTVIYNYTNCNFNYNLPIDSAFIVNYSQIDTNTIFLSWQIWQAGVSTSISDTISYLYQTGTSMVSLMIFCGNARTTNTSSFKTFRVNDFVFLNQTVGIKENKKDGMDIKLYPNPFSSSISIQSKLISSIKSVEMINLIGEVIEIKHQINNQEIVLDTDNLKSGFYTISIISKSGQKSSYKVIKQ